MRQPRPLPSQHLLVVFGLLLAGCSACGTKHAEPEPTAPAPAEALQDEAPTGEAQAGPPAEGPFAGHLLLAESPQALVSWTQASEEERAEGLGMLEAVQFGQRIFVRVVVSGFEAPESFELTGSMALKAPDGRLLHEQAIRATQADVDLDAPGVLVLLPGMDIVFDPGDAVGAYHLMGSVQSGERSLELHRELRVAGEGFQLDPAMSL